jgi:hypothetical protein
MSTREHQEMDPSWRPVRTVDLGFGYTARIMPDGIAHIDTGTGLVWQLTPAQAHRLADAMELMPRQPPTSRPGHG